MFCQNWHLKIKWPRAWNMSAHQSKKVHRSQPERDLSRPDRALFQPECAWSAIFRTESAFWQAKRIHCRSERDLCRSEGDLYQSERDSLVLRGPLTSWKVILSATSRSVTWSPKILDLRKCPNPIRTSLGHQIFSGTIFGQYISYSKFHAFSTLWASGAQFSELHRLYDSLCTSVTDRGHLACRNWFINVISNKKYLDKSWTPKQFGHFLHNIFWLALDFGLDRTWEMFESCTSSLVIPYRLSSVCWSKRALRRHGKFPW